LVSTKIIQGNQHVANSNDTSTTENNDEQNRQTYFNVTIPKINVIAPVVIGADPGNEKEYLEALKSGVAHMTGTALPGSPGNVVIYGHTNNREDAGFYEKIFNGLDELSNDDLILITYQNKIYTYRVKDKKVIDPTDLTILNSNPSEQKLTLFTCWPIGTTKERLAIFAELEKSEEISLNSN
jgi:sortase A